MQSKHAERYMSTKDIATTARRRGGIHATLKAATAAWAGPGILILLFLASLAYIAVGGTLALEASPVPEPETSIAEAALMTADAGGSLRRENLSAGSVTATDYFPSGYVNRGRDAEGNVMTYEHD